MAWCATWWWPPTRRRGGAINAFYDGIRCATGEAKTYARFTNGAWDLTPAPRVESA